MDTRLVTLREVLPTWIEVEVEAERQLIVVARPADTAWAEAGLRLRLVAGKKITVGELSPGTIFPARCPERHIQGDQTFCLGLAPVQPTSPALAEQFWLQLHQYLLCQQVAEQTGIWPPNHALSHGDAGAHHERALQLAEELGCVEEYERARLGEPSWITDRKVFVASRTGSAVNGRAPCPRGCRVEGRPGQPVLWKACPRRTGLAELVFHERSRRRKLEIYWREMIELGAKCCGRMRGCRLPGAPDGEAV